jgi:hypothetical protein
MHHLVAERNPTMTTALHTPGPWTVDWQFIIAPDPNGRHPDIYIAEIAEVDDEGRSASAAQQLANGRLIAAAPALLAATEAADVDAAHDLLSDLLEDPDAANDTIRDAAIALCLALNEHQQKRHAALTQATEREEDTPCPMPDRCL